MGKRLEHLALLGHIDLLECLQVGRVDGEELYEAIQLLIHGPVELHELGEVFPDVALLLRGLLQESIRHDERDILSGDPKLKEPVLHSTHGLLDELEARAIEQALLNAGDDAESSRLTDLANFTKEAEIERQLLISS